MLSSLSQAEPLLYIQPFDGILNISNVIEKISESETSKRFSAVISIPWVYLYHWMYLRLRFPLNSYLIPPVFCWISEPIIQFAFPENYI